MKDLRTIGFIKSEKLFEKRIAILPEDLKDCKHCDQLYFEAGYGADYAICDEEYVQKGAHIQPRFEILTKDIICDPKIGEATYLTSLRPETIIFGWIHAVEHTDLTDLLVKQKLTCYAWEDMYYKDCHVFWRNNQIAGEGAVLQALTKFGKMPYESNVAIIGRGNTAMGANRILSGLGANIKFFNRKMEDLLTEEIRDFDIIVNAVLWDEKREDHLLSTEIMKLMRPGSMIIDVSDDDNGAIENSISTTIEKPMYEMNGVLIYAVNNVPSLFYKTATKEISICVKDYLDDLVEDNANEVLEKCLIIKEGNILDEKIVNYQAIQR
ncbi:MAG: N(5)-(carboxyethyl)ornithine synthase [Longicatena sp.]